MHIPNYTVTSRDILDQFRTGQAKDNLVADPYMGLRDLLSDRPVEDDLDLSIWTSETEVWLGQQEREGFGRRRIRPYQGDYRAYGVLL